VDEPGIGSALRRIRERGKLSLSVVARRAKIDDAILSRIERGERRNPQFLTVAKVAYVLGVSLDEIAAEAGIPTSVRVRTTSSAAADIHRDEHLSKALKLLNQVTDRIMAARGKSFADAD